MINKMSGKNWILAGCVIIAGIIAGGRYVLTSYHNNDIKDALNDTEWAKPITKISDNTDVPPVPAPSPSPNTKEPDTSELLRSLLEPQIIARPPCIQEPEHIDLQCQFPTESTDQHDVGSCHAFAAIALMEAAYFRQYGEHVKFSEADLLVRNTILTPLYYHKYNIQSDVEVFEGNRIFGDIGGMLKNGVSRQKTYEEFMIHYPKYRNDEIAMLSWLKSQPAIMRWFVNPAKAMEYTKNDRQMQLLGKKFDYERHEFKEKIKNFEIKITTYAAYSLDNLTREQCKAAGIKQKNFIISELKAGRPVVIGYVALEGEHGVVIDGMRKVANLTYFTLRNSNKVDKYLQDTEFCTICEITSLITPSDKK